ncbi:MAG: hypothetical protein IPM81_11610 [Saprospirales bacterium]|nr:hypothetical protein [Saprospirales bacterium]
MFKISIQVIFLRILPLTALFPLFAPVQQTGWQYIEANDFIRARPAFESALEQSPTDEPALLGLIFLAETVRDQEAYERFANRLLHVAWKPEYIWLFERVYSGRRDEALRRLPPTDITFPAWTLQQADTLFKYRNFDASRQLRSSILPDWDWSVCGPFTNVSGSGYAETTPLETSPFDLLDTFQNEKGLRFHWVKRFVRNPGTPVDFSLLPATGELGAYYANTFIEVPSSRPVAWHITCSAPIKIWLDDQLLFERLQPASPGEWDHDAVYGNLPAGVHRLLVKVADFPEEPSGAGIRLEFNDLGDSADQEEEPQADPDYDTQAGASPAWFVLRCTELENHQLYTDIHSSFESGYTPVDAPWNFATKSRRHLAALQAEWQQRPDQPWRLYLIAKAFAKYGAWEDGEAFLTSQQTAQPGSVFVKFLLAKFYSANDKAERAEALLSEMDTAATPTYAEHYIRLLKINQDQDETQYLAALEHLLQLSPSNWGTLKRYLTFLKEKGRREQLKTIVQQFLEKHGSPKWKNRLNQYLVEESYKPETFKPETDQQREKKFRQAQKRLKTVFDLADYAVVIRYLKQEEKTDAVLAMYDQILAAAPYLSDIQAQKAAYLFERKRSDIALAFVLKQLELRPFDAVLLELAGDIYFEHKIPGEALNWYRRAQKAAGQPGYELAGKMERLQNSPAYSAYFAPLPLETLARDRSWAAGYAGEEAVIALFSQQVVYLRAENKFRAVNKCIIHIQTDAGAKRWTEADLSLLGNINNARVVRKDGTVTSPDLGWGSMAVFKNLQAGDIILLEGGAERGLPDEFEHEMLDLSFVSWPAPVVRATYELLLPRDQEVHFAFNRLSPEHAARDTGDFILRSWEWRQIKKMEDEDAMPDNMDGAAWIMYGDAPDWKGVVQWYLRKTYCRAEPNYDVKNKLRTLLRPGMGEEEIVETLHTFITREINYSYVPFLNSNYIPKKPGSTLSAKVGDCKDVATLMIAMLREQGIPAWYTLVSTHNFSRVEPRPTPFVFNHAIVAYQTSDGQLRFDDLTTDHFPTGVLPDSDADGWALVIREGESQLRRLPNHALDPAITRIELHADATVDTLGTLLIDAQVACHGGAAGQWRETLLRATEEERNKRLLDYYGDGVLSHLNIESAEFFNLDSINAPLRSRVRLAALHQMDPVAGLNILPLPIPLSTPTYKTLFAAERYNDLDAEILLEMSPVREVVDLHFPAGHRLAETPRPREINSAFGQYKLEFEPLPDGLRIRREVTLQQRFIAHTEFQPFKQFYLDMLEADDKLLALIKT